MFFVIFVFVFVLVGFVQLLCILINVGCALGLFVFRVLCFEIFDGSFLGGFVIGAYCVQIVCNLIDVGA